MTLLKWSKLLYIILFVQFLLSSNLWAQQRCDDLLETIAPVISAIVIEDAYEQWGIWERTLNHESHGVRGDDIILLPKLHVPLNQTRIDYISDLGSSSLWDFLAPHQQSQVWINHPFDGSRENPFRDHQYSSMIESKMSASRSMILQGELRGYTIKMGTDRPAGPFGVIQPKKAKMIEEVKLAVRRSRFIHDIDKQIGESPYLAILKDVALVAHHEEPFGYVIRDNRLLDSGRYYLPAFSIPFVGYSIAALHGQNMAEFWGVYYAQALGRAKALFLLRYGLQLTNPNTQNILVELDRGLMPTGRIIFRDMTDTDYVVGISDQLGFFEEMAEDERIGMPAVSSLIPNANLSFANFSDGERASPGSIPAELVSVPPAYLGENSHYGRGILSWTERHNNAYVQTLSQELGVPIARTPLRQASSRMEVTYESFKTEQVQEALRRYSQRN